MTTASSHHGSSEMGKRTSDMVECARCAHFVAPHAPLCAACGTPRSGTVDQPTAATHLGSDQPVQPRRVVSLRAKIAWIFLFSLAVATFSWQQRYGELPMTLRVGPTFLGETGSYFIGAMPFAIIPRSTGLIIGVGVLLVRALLV